MFNLIIIVIFSLFSLFFVGIATHHAIQMYKIKKPFLDLVLYCLGMVIFTWVAYFVLLYPHMT